MTARAQFLEHVVEHAARVLPAQGPIGVFIHHNTLHAFEDQPFEQAVLAASELFEAEPYMSEGAYRAELARGRIRKEDVAAVIAEEPDRDLFAGLTRRHLRGAMLTPGVRAFDAATMGWRMDHGDLAGDFRDPALRSLFDVCLDRVRVPPRPPRPARPLDKLIHPWLIRLCASFLDQGLARWAMPDREQGFYRGVRQMLATRGAVFSRPLRGLRAEMHRQSKLNLSSREAVLDYLEAAPVADALWCEIITAELLALPGWAGLMRCLEKHPELAPEVALPCALMDYLAVRLTLLRAAAHWQARQRVPGQHPAGGSLERPQAERAYPRPPAQPQRGGPAASRSPATERALLTVRGSAGATQAKGGRATPGEARRWSRAARLYDAARVAGLVAARVAALTETEWEAFQHEVFACHGRERRRLFHLAYERWHAHAILGGLASHRAERGLQVAPGRASAHVFFCIDERAESLRRALEEEAPAVQTLGAAGFFGVAVRYRGLDDAHAAAYCPVTVSPQHVVTEMPSAEDCRLHAQRQRRRRLWMQFQQRVLASSHAPLREALATAALGMVSALAFAAHVFGPDRYARLHTWILQRALPRPRTGVTLIRTDPRTTAEGLREDGFTTVEKTDRVAALLLSSGLTRDCARLVAILGHGSSSLNNPHESAHDCGACGGRGGGPNARLFAAMANRPGVRQQLRARGLTIPDDTWFVGGVHDTCSNEVTWFDVDQVPRTHTAEMRTLRAQLERAQAREAQERVRRFQSRPLRLTPQRALRHVHARSRQWAEPRPEYGHCTNAVCVVGRRALTRGLFLDRRAFLASYDASQDQDGRHLAAVLDAVIPVCAGISLEYYFSFVDNHRYGSGTKLPHNVTGLVAVMDGHASDARTGLPWQMVEIHEPVRCLFVIETSPARLSGILRANPSWRRLVENHWIRIATLDPHTGALHLYTSAGFTVCTPALQPLPQAPSSVAWSAGKLEHLGLASIGHHA